MKRIKTITLLLAILCVGRANLRAQDVSTATDTLFITLDKALEIALSENPTIKIADKEIEKTNYARKEAIGNLIPSITGSASYQRLLKDTPMFMSTDMYSEFPGFDPSTMPDIIARRTGIKNSYTVGANVNIPLFLMGLYRGIEMADLNIEVALEASRESKVALKNEVEKSFYAILMAQNSHEVMAVSMKNAEDNYNDIKLKYEQGVVAEFDMIRADVQVSNIRPSYLQAKNNLLIADLQLKLLMGLPLDITLFVEGKLLDHKEDYKNDNTLYTYSLNQNTDLRKLAIQEELLKKQLQLQKTQRMPTLGASFSYGFMTQSNDFKFLSYMWFDAPTVGLSLNIPIFNGFTLKNKEKQLKVNISQLQLQRDYRRSSLNVEARNALNAMQNAVEQIEANENSVRQAEKAYDISKTRYDSGMGTVLEMNDAEVALTQAKLNYNQAIYSYLTAKSDYIKILGSSF